MATTIFKEKQHYNDKLNIALLAIFFVCAVYGAVKCLIGAEVKILNASILILSAVLFATGIWWLTRIQMGVWISDKKIKYKMKPFHKKKHALRWSDIVEYEVVKTSPSAQLSGGNMSFSREKRFSITGRNGLAIRTKSGDQYFIGCKNVDQLEKIVDRLDLEETNQQPGGF